MKILAIETSCDETGTAILSFDSAQDKEKNPQIQIRSNIVASSAKLQAKYGGVIPEQAAREQIKSIIPVIEEALRQAQCKPNQLDAIAVTYGPGLIGSLLVGVETAKILSLIWRKPLILINHLIGHFYANWIGVTPKFPCIGLLVSGGHTDLVLFTNHGKYKYLGGTRDDAAGECFDKCARLLGLPYPGGPAIAKLAKNGNSTSFNLPRPMIDSNNFDFSFSGLKTAVANLINTSEVEKMKSDLAASIQQAIIEVLVKKTVEAAKKYKVDQIILAGGVAANQNLRESIDLSTQKNYRTHVRFFVPPPHLCTDNAAMIASAAFFTGKKINPLKLQANPNLSLSY